MPEYATTKTSIEALQKQYESDLKTMQDELQKKSDAYDKEKATLPEKHQTAPRTGTSGFVPA